MGWCWHSKKGIFHKLLFKTVVNSSTVILSEHLYFHYFRQTKKLFVVWLIILKVI